MISDRTDNERIEIVAAFSETLAACKGKVIFETAAGDRLVADSMLSALIGLSNILSFASQVDLNFVCELKEDEARLNDFMSRYGLDRRPDPEA